MWDGEYLCWSLKELASINMMAKASKHPPGLQSPHVTKKIRLPSGNACHFPLKAKYDRQSRSIDGIGEIQAAVQGEEVVTQHIVCPDEHVDMDVPGAIVPGSSSNTVVLPQPGTLNRMDVHLGLGYEFDSGNHLCRRDVVNRLYRVDEYGKKVINCTTTCPPHLDSDTWWKFFTPKDRVRWYADMKAREAEEAKAKNESASSSTGVDAVDLRATPAPFAAPKERRKSLIQKTRQLGIAGLFSNENETYLYNESDSEASTSGAAPASIIESEDEDVSPWECLENELEAENAICAAARESPQKRDDEIPAMPCVANYKGEPHRPKIVPFNSHSWLVMNACVARPVSRKGLLQSPPAQASMKAGWDRLRNKMVWDEDKVREWSDVACEAQHGNYELNFGYLFGICVEKDSELPPLHPKRKFKGRVVFQGNRVTNQNWEAIVFQDMGSCPATMEASRAASRAAVSPWSRC